MTGQWGADANVLGWQKADVGGTSTTGATLASVRTHLIGAYLADGLGPYGKFFDGGSGWHTAYTNFHGSGYGAAANERHPVICAKSHTTAAFNTLMTDMHNALPAGETWYACFFSEPEDDFNSGALTHSDYQAAWASMNTLRAAHAHGSQVKFIPILMAYQEISGTSHWSTFLSPVLSVADVIGWDVYNDNGDPQSWSFATDIYPAIQALQTASGLPWAIPEYGLQVSTHSGSTDNAAGVLSRWEAMVATCEADPDFLWGNYWMDGPHAANQRSAVIRTDTANADYLTSLVAGGATVNGNFADAIELSGSSGTVTGTNVSATTETGEPDTSWGTASVWWSWTPTADMVVSFDTFGSLDGTDPLDTTLIVYTGSVLTSLTRVAINDDNGGSPDVDNRYSKVIFAATASTTYHIRVAAYSGTGNITLNWAPATIPANNDFANAHPLGRTRSLTADNTGATAEIGEPTYAATGRDPTETLWYSFTPAADDDLTVAVTVSPDVWWSILEIYTGTDFADLTIVGSTGAHASNTLTVSVTSGVTYWIRVGSGNGSTAYAYAGPFSLSWDGPVPATPSVTDLPLQWLFDATVPGYVATGTDNGDSDQAWAISLAWGFIVDVEPPWDDTPLIDLTSSA